MMNDHHVLVIPKCELKSVLKSMLKSVLKSELKSLSENELKSMFVGVPTSFPTGIPLPRPAVRPMTLATKAFRVRYSFSTTPLRMVFSSGIPEPGSQGERQAHNQVLLQPGDSRGERQAHGVR